MTCWFAMSLMAAACDKHAAPSASAEASTPADDPSAGVDARCEGTLPLSLPAGMCERVASLALPDALRPAAGNRYADDADAARLGFLVFYDPRFSTVPDVRCATCHLPEHGFDDAKTVSEVIPGQPVTRNSPSILNAAWAGPFYFWDGRADSLWSQPLFAFENEREMASTRLAIAHALFDTDAYKTRYESLFGALPELSDSSRFPATGKPGDASFDGMNEADRDAIDRVVANLGKSLEAYVRKVATGPSPLDHFLAGDGDALEPAARAGLGVFAKRGCIDCHSGPSLSDGAFHVIGDSGGDPGRAAAIAVLNENPFNSRGRYFDADAAPAPDIPPQPTAADQGAFRTPTLRNLAITAPYGHDGRFATLQDFFASEHGSALSADEINDVTVFLLALKGSYPPRPWSDWPAR